jgi:hypothetical protein
MKTLVLTLAAVTALGLTAASAQAGGPNYAVATQLAAQAAGHNDYGCAYGNRYAPPATVIVVRPPFPHPWCPPVVHRPPHGGYGPYGRPHEWGGPRGEFRHNGRGFGFSIGF